MYACIYTHVYLCVMLYIIYSTCVYMCMHVCIYGIWYKLYILPTDTHNQTHILTHTTYVCTHDTQSHTCRHGTNAYMYACVLVYLYVHAYKRICICA